MSAPATSFSSPIKTSGPPLEGRTASESIKDSRELDLVIEIPRDVFTSAYLLNSDNASTDWQPHEQDLVGEIRNTSVGNEKSMYTGSAPLLRLLNSISKRVFDRLEDPNTSALVFSTSDKQQLQDPYSNQRRFPDLIVTWELADVLDQQIAANDHLPLPDTPKTWSTLVAVGEAKVHADGRYQLANYLRDLMRNHPELDAMLGFAVRATGYEFFYHDACVIYRSGHFPWTMGPMHAFVRRLYSRPFRDTSRCILRAEGKSSWATKIGKDVYISQRSRPEPGPGQRRFTTLAIHMVLGFLLFIKDFWRDSRRRFFEGSLYAKAHHGQSLAGLMFLAHSGFVVDADGKPRRTTEVGPGPGGQAAIVRYKMRITTRDIGAPLEEIRSLRKLLCVMFDACVVQRNLYRKAKILHRDISDANIMVAPDTAEYRERCASGYADVKFVNQVLSADENTKPNPACLVIDLGNGADLDSASGDEQELAGRTGTPKFIARSVACGKLLAFDDYRSDLTRMPKLVDRSLKLYQSTIGMRYDEYNEMIDKGPFPETSPHLRFKHQLFHDAESTFWVLAWILARSAQQGYLRERAWTAEFEIFANVMRDHYPNNRTPDSRLTFQSSKDTWEKILHDDLAGLASMVSEMHRYVRPEWAYREQLDVEHVHEALMRLMLREIVRIDESGVDIPLAVGVRSLPPRPLHGSTAHSLSATSLLQVLPRSRSQSKKTLESVLTPPRDIPSAGSSRSSRKRSGSHLADQSTARRSPYLCSRLEPDPIVKAGDAAEEDWLRDPLVAAAGQIVWEEDDCMLQDPRQGCTNQGQGAR